MKKNVWILNHYATNTYKDRAGRHYWFAKCLLNKEYEPTIFCASTIHNSKEIIDTEGDNFLKKEQDNINYVFIKTPQYKGNGKSRIINMISFYKNLFPTSKKYSKISVKPDVILASSVHPLTLIAGIKIAKKFGIPCICEIRDLWPETLVAYGRLKKSNILTKTLYQGEKWIYKKADKLIFTMEGGKDYIVDKKWDIDNGGPINLKKVNHLNNGIDLFEYDKNIKNNQYEDSDLDDSSTFKIIYAGSIRKANNIDLIIETAKYIESSNKNNIKFIIFGDGDEKEKLQKKCMDENINNVVFKGRVEKKFIPNILSKSNLNILNYSYHDIWKYGGSQNKTFEYLASGKPILSTISMGYDIIKKYNAGISLKNQNPESISKEIIKISQMDEEKYNELANNARKAAKDYDFKILTDKLINIIEN